MSDVDAVSAKTGAEPLLHDWRAAARMIDHTLLRPEATREQIIEHCRQAAPYGFATVCVNPCWVALAVAELKSTGTKVDATVGFPHGAVLTAVKRYEAEQLIRIGAGELDMVINVGMLKSGERKYVEKDIRAVAEVAHRSGAILKVILEATLLTRDEKILACELALAASADFVKTSTGLVGGATVDDVRLLRSTVSDRAGVKASGGIRTASEFAAMVNAGANRIGTSAGVKIVKELGAP